MLRRFLFICPLFLLTLITLSSGQNIKDSIQNLLNKAGSDSAKIKILLTASSYENIDPQSATEYCITALGLSQKNHDRMDVAQSYYTLGIIAYTSRTLTQSHSYFLKASILFDSLHNTVDIAKAYSALGDVLGDEGNGKKAIDYYKIAKTNFYIAHDTLHALYMDMSVAGTLGMMNLLDSSLSYSLHVLPVAEKFKNENLTAKLTANIGGTYNQKKMPRKALVYFLRALPYFEKDKVISERADIYRNIGDAYLNSGDQQNAEKYAQKAYESSKEGNYNEGIVEASRLLARTYMKKKEYATAAEWYEKTCAATDTLFSKNMATQVAEMQTKYETVKKEKAISELNEKELIKNTQLSRQRIIIYAGVAILLLILAGAVLLYNNNRKITRLNRALEELNTIKNKLFGIISHDLRNPLMSIDATIKMLRKGGLSEDQVQKFTSNLEASMNSTLALIDNLLAWSLSQMEGARFEIETLNIEAAVDENLALYSQVAAFKNISLHSGIAHNTLVQADRNVMHFVIRNLLSNAIKFTRQGGNIEISTREEAGKIIFRIKDNGTGIEQSIQEKLFELGREKIKSGTAKEKGSGLGLTLCRDLLRKTGGDITVESTEGQGATFIVSLPAAA